jgi:pimeloyl-ACP methyl ester carboxylesterase
MAIQAFIEGDRSLPLLVCVPGMFGMPDNFRRLGEAWEGRCCLVLLDLSPSSKESGLKDAETSLSQMSYDNSAQEMHDYLMKEFPGRKFYFLGISLGGKIIFDFAAKFPQLYAGGVVTDIGLGALNETELYQFSMNTIPQLNLKQDWNGIKAELRAKVSVNTIRVFMMTQVEYKAEEGRGYWRKAVHGIQEFLDKQNIKDQWHLLPDLKTPTTILKAESLSGISASDYERIKELPEIFHIDLVEGAAHFVHITHPHRVQNAVSRVLEGGADAVRASLAQPDAAAS